MVAGIKIRKLNMTEGTPFVAKQPKGPATNRNLDKSHLGGVIFGCKDTTMQECVLKQLFGLPAGHFSYIKNIKPGLPLFLFNYDTRELHGIFEAASVGQMYIDPYAWTRDASEKSTYPAQVQVCRRMPCNPLPEKQFKPIIVDNYYRPHHFWFELDHLQTSKLLTALTSQSVAPRILASRNTGKWRALFSPLRSQEINEETEGHGQPALEVDYPHPDMFNELVAYSQPHMSDDSDASMNLSTINQPAENCPIKQVVAKEEDLIYKKLKELSLNRKCPDLPFPVAKDDVAVSAHSRQLEEHTNSVARNEKTPVNSSEYASVVAQLVQEVVELKTFKEAHIQKLGFMEKKLVAAETEIRKLKHRCAILESSTSLSTGADVGTFDSVENLELDVQDHDSFFLLGGYDGENWLSTLDTYSLTNDVVRSLKPMSCIRSYASVVKLNGEIFAFAGGNGVSWYDTVESYDPTHDQWTSHPSLSSAKGSLAGCTLNDKIFAIGGGNGSECFADVEMLDLEAGRWISTQSMLHKRFSLAAVELNGALYVTGGYDGTGYLSSAERFDPREHSWRKIGSMSTKRGCHSMAVLNEKIYAIGGHNSELMVPSVEIYDPRLCSWMEGEPMIHPRGYSASVVLNESIYVIGGVITETNILDTVECYKEGQGWKVTHHNAIGKRAFSAAIVL